MNDIQLFEIYDFAYVPFWQTWWFLGLIGLTALIVLAFLLFSIIRWYRQRAKVPALEAIAALKALNVHERQASQFYEELSAIIKRYFSSSYKRSFAALTDREFFEIVYDFDDLTEHDKKILKNIFCEAETIRFAARHALASAMAHDAQEAAALIMRHYEQSKSKAPGALKIVP